MPNEISCVHYMGVRIDDVDYSGVSGKIRKVLRRNGKAYICVNDVASVIIANQDREVFRAINSSLLSIADGTPLAWFGRLVGCRKIERISGMDLLEKLFAENTGYRHYLLGDTEHTIGRVIEKASKRYQGISIDGYSPPFKDFDDEDNRIILQKLNEARPDIIWVSLGGGKQDKWMYNNFRDLERGIMIGVGAAFRWFTGDLVTPPKIVQKMGLQCLYRIAHYITENPRKNLGFVVGTVLRRNMLFIVNFPREVLKARQKSKEESFRRSKRQKAE